MELSVYLNTNGRGTISQLARSIGAHVPDVWRWSKKQRPVPERSAPAIEHATGGKVTVEDLSSDPAWARIPDPHWPHPAGRPVLDYGAAPAAAPDAPSPAQPQPTEASHG